MAKPSALTGDGEPSFKVKTQERSERGQIVHPRCMVVTGEPSFKEKTLAASLFHFQLIQ
jgi:hypothetical protein